MLYFWQSKPRSPVMIEPDVGDTLYLHKYEDEATFDRAVGFYNNMANMFKMFAPHKREGYAFGKEETFELDGVGIYGEDFWSPSRHEVPGYGNVFTRGVWAQRRMEDGFKERYGDTHDNWIDGTYWGYDKGSTATNMDIATSSAGTLDNFTDMDAIDYDKVLDVDEYRAMVYDGYGAGVDTPLAEAPEFAAYTQTELDAAVAYVNENFEGKSWYEIALTGIDNSHIGSKDGSVGGMDVQVIDWADIQHSHGFLYDGKENVDGKSGKGAYYLAVVFLEMCRRINYGMSYIFGSPFRIIDSQHMINNFDDVFSNPDKLGGLDDGNKRAFEVFLDSQHPWRGILAAYRGGVNISNGALWAPAGGTLNNPSGRDSGGFRGGDAYLYTARDQAGFQRFRHWMWQGLNDYKTSSGDSKVDLVMQEWRGDIEQPALADQAKWNADELNPDLRAGYETCISWDRYTLYYNGSTTGHNTSNKPYAVNPWTASDCHRDYTFNQVWKLDKGMLLGNKDVEGKNLYNTNWMVHASGNFISWRQATIQKVVNAMGITRMDAQRYKREMKDYRKEKAEHKEKLRDEKEANAQDDAKRAKLKNMTKTKNKQKKKSSKSAQNKKSQQKKQKQSDITMQDAMNKLYLGMLKRMQKSSKERNKKAEEARKG